MSARLWFAGTPAFAAHSLQALLDSGDYHIDGVLTQPDRPAGRGRTPRTESSAPSGSPTRRHASPAA